MSDLRCNFHPTRLAHRIIPKLGGICDECYQNGQPWGHMVSKIESQEEVSVPRKITVDKVAMQAERDKGTTLQEVATMFNVSVSTVVRFTKGSSKRSPRKTDVLTDVSYMNNEAGRIAKRDAGSRADAIENALGFFIEERDKLNTIIATLQELA